MNLASAATDLHELLRKGVAQQASNAADWFSARQQEAAAEVLEMPLPERSQEAWRYTPISFLEEQSFQLAPREVVNALEMSDIEALLLDHDSHRLVFVNGHLVPALSDLRSGQAGLSIGNIASGAVQVDAAVRGQVARIASHRHVFEALNTALVADGAIVHVDANTVLRKPIELLHVSVDMDEPVMAHPRHLLALEAGAKAQVIERYCSLGDSRYFNNALIEVALHEGSCLEHQRVQEESGLAQHISDLHVRQGSGSRYQLAQASIGAAWSRSDVRVELLGEMAQSEIAGLLLACDRQLTDMHLDVHHRVPSCSSRESVKGVLDGKGRIVFDGHIHVARNAQKTDAMLSNDNLMLSRSAEVDTKPQLEIFADDVKCSHGTTVGELDQDMLFYLRSRGIGEHQARQMLAQGFAQHAVDAFASEALRQRLASQLAIRLRGSA